MTEMQLQEQDRVYFTTKELRGFYLTVIERLEDNAGNVTLQCVDLNGDSWQMIRGDDDYRVRYQDGKTGHRVPFDSVEVNDD